MRKVGVPAAGVGENEEARSGKMLPGEASPHGAATAMRAVAHERPVERDANQHHDFRPEPGDLPAERGAARAAGAAMAPFASGVYVNAIADEGESGVRRAYRPEKLARLRELKRRYDPDNVLHLNQNIRPEEQVTD